MTMRRWTCLNRSPFSGSSSLSSALRAAQHVQRVAGVQGAVDGIAAVLIDAIDGCEHLFQRLEKAKIGWIGHRGCLSLQEPAPVYRGRR